MVEKLPGDPKATLVHCTSVASVASRLMRHPMERDGGCLNWYHRQLKKAAEADSVRRVQMEWQWWGVTLDRVSPVAWK